MKISLVVFLQAHRYDQLYQASSTLLTASTMGWKCHLFLFYGALASFAGGEWDDVNITTEPEESHHAPPWMNELQQGFEQANVPSLYEMIDKAKKADGGLQVCACSASCKMLGLDLASVRGKVDEVVGLPTMLQIAENATHVVHI